MTLNRAPTANLSAATKGYVDGSVQALDSRFLPLAGGTLTGALTLSANPVQPLQAASKAYVDAALSGQAVVAAQAEVNAGVNDGKFVTALKAATRYLAKVGDRLGGVLLPPATTVLTDDATITPDFSAGHDFTVTLGGNRTLANPINVSPNQSGSIVIKQDGTGGRTLVLGSFFKFPNGTAPSLSTAPTLWRSVPSHGRRNGSGAAFTSFWSKAAARWAQRRWGRTRRPRPCPGPDAPTGFCPARSLGPIMTR